MSCEETQSCLNDYFNNSLSEQKKGEIKLHISQCRRCADKFHVEAGFRKAMSNMSGVPSSPESSETIFRQMAASHGNKRRSRAWYSTVGALAAAGLLWITSAILSLIFQSH